MNDKIKNYLGMTIIVSIIVVALSAALYASSFYQSVRYSSQRDFSVSADGKAVGVPDVAKFNFSVITEGGKEVEVLQNENSQKMNKVIEFLKAQKIDLKDIQTQNYNVDPRYQYCSSSIGKTCPPSEIAGYSVTQSVNVKIRNFSQISDILSGVVVNGANAVSQLLFEIDDPTALENQARAEAVQKAKGKAIAIAKVGGFRVGKIVSITEGGGYAVGYRYDSAMGMGGGSKVVPEIEPGSKEVSMNVTITYEIR